MKSNAALAEVPQETPDVTVRAYKIMNRTLVKYYDDGEGDSVSCPFCDWHGVASGNLSTGANGLLEVLCPHCHALLGAVI